MNCITAGTTSGTITTVTSTADGKIQQQEQQWLVRFHGKTHVIDLLRDDVGDVHLDHGDNDNNIIHTDDSVHATSSSSSSFSSSYTQTTKTTNLTTMSTSMATQLLHILSDRVKWPVQRLYVRTDRHDVDTTPTTTTVLPGVRYPFVTVEVRSCIVGGKGGFGTLLKGQSRQAGAKLTTDFGACRDLQGRRLRHVNDEIKLRRFRDRQRREAAGEKVDVDELYKTPSGIYNWHLMTPTWADVSKKAAYKIRRQFQSMEREEERKVALKKEKDEVYQRTMTMYLDETTSTSQSIQNELQDALKQGLKQQQQQQQKNMTKKNTTTTTSGVKKRKRSVDNDDDTNAAVIGGGDSNNGDDDGMDSDTTNQEPTSLVRLTGDVVVSEGGSSDGRTTTTDKKSDTANVSSSSVQIQSKSEFMTAVLVLDGEIPQTEKSTPAAGTADSNAGASTTSSSSTTTTTTTLYYEVTLVTGDLAQIGWACLATDGGDSSGGNQTKSTDGASTGGGGFTPNNDLGDGVGDDAYSYGIDLSRGRKFHGGEDWEFGSSSNVWKAGDRLGCMWNQSTGDISYTLNGQPVVDGDGKNVAFVANKSFQYLFPAFSCNQGEILALHTKKQDCKFLPADTDTHRFVPVGEMVLVDNKTIETTTNSTAAADKDKETKVVEKTETSLLSSKTSNDTKQASVANVAATTPPPQPPTPLDLSKYQSVEELQALGLDRLKSALLAIHVKCGGTLEERAKRLFSLKGLDPKDYPAKVRAKRK